MAKRGSGALKPIAEGAGTGKPEVNQEMMATRSTGFSHPLCASATQKRRTGSGIKPYPIILLPDYRTTSLHNNPHSIIFDKPLYFY